MPLKPGENPLHQPASFVGAQSPPILRRLCLSVTAMRRHHFGGHSAELTALVDPAA
jgi:hypothetical protein